MGSLGRALPYHKPFDWTSTPPFSLVTTTVTTYLSLRLCRLLHQHHQHQRHRLHLHFILHSSVKGNHCWNITAFKVSTIKGGIGNHFAARKTSRNTGTSHSETSRINLFNGRQWTNILLAVNVLIHVAQFVTQSKLLLWGAKINSLIAKGQFWRLVTFSFLHANIVQCMVNCYSLNSIGPAVEIISGSRRYLAVYFSSAIASSAMSYQFCKAPAVGASGAILGLVGSFTVFVMRHRNLVGGGKEDLQHIAQVIILNMAFGLLSKGIDNWGHLGGLLGGAAMSWLLGPAWKYESTSNDGSRIFSDRAPIFYLIDRKRNPRSLK